MSNNVHNEGLHTITIIETSMIIMLIAMELSNRFIIF